MSRYDAEHERAWAEQAARDAANFTVGATVYRHHFGTIQQGVVTKVGRCNDPDYGDTPDGKCPYYLAAFVCQPRCNPHYEAQTFSSKFVATPEEAVAQLIRYLEGGIEEHNRGIWEKTKRIADLRAGKVEVWLEGSKSSKSITVSASRSSA